MATAAAAGRALVAEHGSSAVEVAKRFPPGCRALRLRHPAVSSVPSERHPTAEPEVVAAAAVASSRLRRAFV